MKGFEAGFSSSKSNASPNLSSSGSMENDENDSSVDKLIPQFESQNIIHGEDFMSGAPRKKILAEIYQYPSASDAQNHEIPDPYLEKSPPKKVVGGSIVSCYGHASEPKDDSSVNAYNPLTNYLSPRPKYLRFNPNRRSEILKRLENEGREELSSPDSVKVYNEEELSAEDVEDCSLSPAKVYVAGEISDENNDNVVDGYEAEEEEVEEEEIEERGWRVRGVLKFLLALIACLLLTSYICSMNSWTVPPSQQATWNLNNGGVVIKNGSLDFVSKKMHVDGLFQVEVGGSYGLIEEVEANEESHGEIDRESIKAEIVEILEQFENFETDESLETEEEEEEDEEESYGEIDENIEAEIVENLERFEREMIGNENNSKEMVDESADIEFRADEHEPLVDAKTHENLSDGAIWFDEEVDSGLDVYEASEREITGVGVVDSNPQSWEQLMDATTVEKEDQTESIELDGEISDLMNEVEDDDEVGEEKPEWNTTTVVGASAGIIVLTSLAIIYDLKKSRSPSSKEFEPELKQDFAVEENELPSIDRKVEFLARAPMREAPQELTACHIHAPTVELIGEITVGKPRGSGKYKMNVSENEYNVATLHQIHAALPQQVSAPSQPPATELHPTTSNSSYGSFTAERKTSRKEGGQSRESMIETTPVRRSRRLRNRSTVVSP